MGFSVRSCLLSAVREEIRDHHLLQEMWSAWVTFMPSRAQPDAIRQMGPSCVRSCSLCAVTEDASDVEIYAPHWNSRTNLKAQLRRGSRAPPNGFNPRSRGERRARARSWLDDFLQCFCPDIAHEVHGLIKASRRWPQCDEYVSVRTPVPEHGASVPTDICETQVDLFSESPHNACSQSISQRVSLHSGGHSQRHIESGKLFIGHTWASSAKAHAVHNTNGVTLGPLQRKSICSEHKAFGGWASSAKTHARRINIQCANALFQQNSTSI